MTILILDEMYTFTPDDGSGEIHIRSGALRRELLATSLDLVHAIEIGEQTMDDIIERYGVDMKRVAAMSVAEAAEPVIIALRGEGAFMIDGAHRRAYWAQKGIHTLRGWLLPEEAWRNYVVTAEDPGILAMGIDASLLPQRRGL